MSHFPQHLQMGRHETFSFLQLQFFFHFSLQPHFLKAIFAKFFGRGVLLGEIQLHKILSLLILQVKFDGGSSVFLLKFDLPHVRPET